MAGVFVLHESFRTAFWQALAATSEIIEVLIELAKLFISTNASALRILSPFHERIFAITSGCALTLAGLFVVVGDS